VITVALRITQPTRRRDRRGARHAAEPQHTGPVVTATAKTLAATGRGVAAATTWVLTPHDDRVPNLVQYLLWFAAFAALLITGGRS
jgi:hypothetical protein